MLRFEEALSGWTEKRLTQEEAARLLGVCARTFRCHVDRHEEAGLDGLVNRRMSEVSARQAAGGRGAASGGAVPGEPSGVVGGALPRCLPGAPRGGAVVHVGEEPAAGGGAGGEGEVGGKPRRRRERAADPGAAGAPGRLDARVGAGIALGSDHDDGRRDLGGVLGVLRGGGGDVVEPARGPGDAGVAGAVLQPVHRPRVPLLAYAAGWWEGGQVVADAVRAGDGGVRDRDDRVVLGKRRVAVRSASSGRCRAGCRGSWRTRGSRRWRRGTATCSSRSGRG